MRTFMSRRKDRSNGVRSPIAWFVAVALAGGCATEFGETPLEFELPGESAEPLAAANCEGAELCTAPTLTRGSCFVALTDTDVKREVAQTFSVSRAAQPGSVRLTLKKLSPEPAGTTPRLKLELRELESGKVPLGTNRTVATATVEAADLPTSDLEKEISFDSTFTLQPSILGAGPRYALVLSVENGRMAVGVGCTDGATDTYPTGTALQRQMRRLSPTAFSSPPFSADTRDLSFAFLLACGDGLADCDLNGANWCETPIYTDVNNCGGCGLACSRNHITPGCVGGSCDAGACHTGWGDCNDDKRSDGCETNIQTSLSHCGACNSGCSTSNIVAQCASGSCEGGTCLSGFADCNNNKRSDGCEVNLNTNPNHCGGCSVSCSGVNIPNRTCSAGVCSGACAAGFADCNSNKQADGCETNLNNDPGNCGACNSTCSANNIAPACSGGNCSGTCHAGFADCNNDKRTDGCETGIAANPNACGGCGIVCSSNHMATRTCGGGVCNGTCAAGWGDCNNDKRTDGCETPLDTTTNCGACGNVCGLVPNAQTNACQAGACKVTACSAGFYDLDGNYANGCECQDDDPAPDQCLAPRDLGTLNSTQQYQGKIPTTSGTGSSDYVVINIPLNSGGWGQKFGSNSASTLNIRFGAGTHADFRFDVIAGPCSGTARQCSTAGGTANGLREFSLTDNRDQTCRVWTQSQQSFGNPNGVGSQPGSTSPWYDVTCGCKTNTGTGTNGAANTGVGGNACRVRRDAANNAVAWNNSFVVRVYRLSTPTNCLNASYTLEFSRN